MAAKASIVIEVNDTGAITALKGINAETAKMGPTLVTLGHVSEQTFNNIEGGALRARESAALMREELGVNIPRALRGVIAQSTILGPLFNAMFMPIAALTFVTILESAVSQLDKLIDKMHGWNEQAKRTMDAQIALNNAIIKSNESVEKLKEEYDLIGLTGLPRLAREQETLNAKLRATQKAADDAGESLKKLQNLPGIPWYVQLAQGIEKADRLFSIFMTVDPVLFPKIRDSAAEAAKKLEDAGNAANAANTPMALMKQHLANIQKEMDHLSAENAVKQFNALVSAEQALFTRTNDAMAKMQLSGAPLSAEAQIRADADAQLKELQTRASFATLGTDLQQAYAAKRVEIAAKAEKDITKLLQDAADAHSQIHVDELEQQEKDDQRHAEKLRRFEDQTINAEHAAAIASAPPWEKANARIVADYQARMDKIHEMEKTEGEVFAPFAAREAAAAWTDAFAAKRDELAGQMQSLFDDITSGNIGQRFKKLFEKMVFEMVATWILGMQGMRAASAGAMGGGSGGILGSLFGMLGLGGIFGGRASAGAAAGSGGAASGIPGMGSGATPPFLPGAAALLGVGGLGAGGILGGGSVAGNVGTTAAFYPGGAGVTGAGGVAAGGILGSGMSGMLNKVFSHGIGLGKLGKVGGPALAMTGLMLGIDAFSRGGVLGMLEGAAGGAMTGFAKGGPIGAVIGGIVGFFAGLFGGGAKKRARNKLAADLTAQIKTIVDAYNNFQTDLPSATTSLESLRAQVGAQMHKLGGNTNALVNQPIDAAEAQLASTDAERVRRAAITFGPAEFHAGGFVNPGLASSMSLGFRSSAMRFAGGGEVPAILHAGEFVMQPSAVRGIGRANLEQMNATGGAGGMEVHMHFPNVYDAQNFEDTLMRNAVPFMRVIRRMKNEGWRGNV